MIKKLDTIGERIKFLRQNIHKLTQQDLSDATGISRGNLSNYEKDRFKPASDAIIAIANYFNVSTDWLLTGKEIINPDKDNLKSDILNLSDEEIYFINLLRQLDKKDRLKIEGIMEFKIKEYSNLEK